MRVEKKFAPVTLVIETEDDKKFILNVLQAAKRQEAHSCLPWHRGNNSFVQKCNYLEEQIR